MPRAPRAGGEFAIIGIRVDGVNICWDHHMVAEGGIGIAHRLPTLEKAGNRLGTRKRAGGWGVETDLHSGPPFPAHCIWRGLPTRWAQREGDGKGAG